MEFNRIASDVEKKLADHRRVNGTALDQAYRELTLLRQEIPEIQARLDMGDYRGAYYAASNLRVRGNLLLDRPLPPFAKRFPVPKILLSQDSRLQKVQ